MSTKKENIYRKEATENIQNRPFFECPINATHNTLINHKNIFIDSVIKDLNRRLAEIVISTIKYPVFIDIDIKCISKAVQGEAAAQAECIIIHGVGISKFKDFLELVTILYNKETNSYPLIINFDGNESIFNEIESFVTEAVAVKPATSKTLNEKSFISLDNFNLTTSNKQLQVKGELIKIFFPNKVPNECSTKPLRELMGKIIFRKKIRNDNILGTETSKLNYIEYMSSKSIEIGRSGIKYPVFDLAAPAAQGEAEAAAGALKNRLLRIYPGINQKGFINHQKKISSDIITKLNNLFEVGKGKGDPTPTYIKFKGEDGEDAFEAYLESKGSPPAGKIVTATSKLEFPKWTSESSLGPINMISYNYPFTKERKIVEGKETETETETDFEKLERNFYEFYNGEGTGNETIKSIFDDLKTKLKL
jgi:hypothetical protein